MISAIRHPATITMLRLRHHGVTDVILSCSYRVDDVQDALVAVHETRLAA